MHVGITICLHTEGACAVCLRVSPCRLWSHLAHLVDELHSRRCVAHCDLKPGNVLLSSGRLLLADFSESLLFHTAPLLEKEAR